MLEPVKVTSLKQTLYQAPSEVCTSQHHTPSEICTLHQVIRGFLGEESTIPGKFFYIFTRDVTLAYDDDASRTLDFRDVTLAYDDDVIGDLDFRDVTLAYDDDAKGNKSFRMSH